MKADFIALASKAPPEFIAAGNVHAMTLKHVKSGLWYRIEYKAGEFYLSRPGNYGGWEVYYRSGDLNRVLRIVGYGDAVKTKGTKQ